MKAIEQCYEETVEVRAPQGLVKVKGYRWQDFAVVVERQHWLIAHLPSGLVVGAEEKDTVWTFTSAESAAGAMIEISRLRNRWVEIPASEFDKTASQVDDICRRHAGIIRGGKDRPAELKRASINGYEEPFIEKESK